MGNRNSDTACDERRSEGMEEQLPHLSPFVMFPSDPHRLGFFPLNGYHGNVPQKETCDGKPETVQPA